MFPALLSLIVWHNHNLLSLNMLTRYAFFVATAILVLPFGPVSAFWRLLCMGVAGVARIDPLISPGKQSGHVHTIKGSSGGFGLNPF